MEKNGIKIHFIQSHENMTGEDVLSSVNAGHLVFNIPTSVPEFFASALLGQEMIHNETTSEYSASLDIGLSEIIHEEVVSREIIPELGGPAPREIFREQAVEEEIVEEVYPFSSLKIKNQMELFRIGKTFVKDIEQGQKQFGFASLSNCYCEEQLLAYGSFINYTLKRPVLIVVKDLKDKFWDQYRANFSKGTIWKWNCSDWGNLCFVDYAQINSQSSGTNSLNFEIIAKDFAAVMWALPRTDVNAHVPRNALNILEKMNSITFVLKKGKALAKDAKKAAAYYQCFGISVKGFLTEEKVK